MKKLVLSTLALVAGTILGYSQGTVALNNTSASFLITTNGSSVAEGTGNAWGGGGAQVAYDYEVLDMVDAADNSVSSLAANITNVLSSSIFTQWTDSGVTGSSENLVSKGGIVSGSSTAANWSSPGTSSVYGGGGQTPIIT